ncbi:hypothetical protein EMIT0P100_80002 [Pseudomonas sp. IT-P100]
MAGGFRCRLIVNSPSICQQSLGVGLLALVLFSTGVCQTHPAFYALDTAQSRARPTAPSYNHVSVVRT